MTTSALLVPVRDQLSEFAENVRKEVSYFEASVKIVEGSNKSPYKIIRWFRERFHAVEYKKYSSKLTEVREIGVELTSYLDLINSGHGCTAQMQIQGRVKELADMIDWLCNDRVHFDQGRSQRSRWDRARALEKYHDLLQGVLDLMKVAHVS